MVERDEKIIGLIERTLTGMEERGGGLADLTILSRGAIKSTSQAIQYIREGTPVGNAIYGLFKRIYEDNQL